MKGVLGYTDKESGQPHFRNVRSTLCTAEVMAAAKREYLMHGNIATKGRAVLAAPYRRVAARARARRSVGAARALHARPARGGRAVARADTLCRAY